ncbi:MAG: hypothetical protein NVS9B13_25940 [Candidatus Acidiferrum sp.]
MNVIKKYPKVLLALVFFSIGAAFLSARVAGQDDGWRVVRATYGSRTQVNDVTGLLLDLLAGGGVNGKILVNDQTMGGDPAPEKDKTLRVFARNSRNEEREFDYDEESYMDVFPFSTRRDPRSDIDRNRLPDDRHRNDDWRERNEDSGLWIIRGFYGVNGKNANVTERLRAMMIGNSSISTKVNNTNMGGDPAPGGDKILILIYRYQNKEQALVLHEGEYLKLP